MKKFAILFFLVCQSLTHVIAGIKTSLQAAHGLSSRFPVFRPVDNTVMFHIPLSTKTDGTKIDRTVKGGYKYQSRFYNVLILEMRGDAIYLAGIETAGRRLVRRMI